MKRVSEVVTIDEVKSWNTGDIITIEAGTGAGKSYFIKNNLYALAKKDNKKILFLVHRSNCFNQFQHELERDNKTDNIHIRTYQSLEALHLRQMEFDFSAYQYIVCDEFHYHIQDASFNIFTDISLNMILEQTDKIRIFMSATGENVRKYINNYRKFDIKPYSIPANYDFIKNLVFFNKNDTMEKIIEQAIEENKKCIFFIQKIDKAYDLYNKYKEYCLFNCSKHNDKYYKHVDKSKINDMLVNERFEELILITTTAMDAGVNIIDKELTSIVADVKDIGTLIQCIGRKRLQDKNDHIELYIKTINNKQLGGMVTQIRRKLERAKYLKQTSTQEYILKYPRDYDKWKIVYNDLVQGDDKMLTTLKVNELVYFKSVIDGALFDMMITESFGYCKYIARLFGFYDTELGYMYNLLEEDYNKVKLEDYLESIIDIKLYSDDQQKLSDIIINELSNSKKDYRTKKLKPSTLETIIRDQFELPYAVSKPKKESKGEKRGQRFIVITKLN